MPPRRACAMLPITRFSPCDDDAPPLFSYDEAQRRHALPCDITRRRADVYASRRRQRHCVIARYYADCRDALPALLLPRWRVAISMRASDAGRFAATPPERAFAVAPPCAPAATPPLLRLIYHGLMAADAATPAMMPPHYVMRADYYANTFLPLMMPPATPPPHDAAAAILRRYADMPLRAAAMPPLRFCATRTAPSAPPICRSRHAMRFARRCPITRRYASARRADAASSSRRLPAPKMRHAPPAPPPPLILLPAPYAAYCCQQCRRCRAAAPHYAMLSLPMLMRCLPFYAIARQPCAS